MNNRLINALKCRNEGRPPVWLMRQAGRYMPEYRALRAKHSFLEMCRQPELIAQVTQLPIDAFGMDAAILFSDILVVAEALGLNFRFEEGVGPLIEPQITSSKDVDAISLRPVSEVLHFVPEGIRYLIPQLKVPLIGFCGAPFTVASYIVEGRPSKDLKKTKQFMLRDPDGFHRLLKILTQVSVDYLKLQIAAGVHAVQIFESWAGVLGAAQFQEFSLTYLDTIVKELKHLNVPTIVFCRGASTSAAQIAKLNPSAMGVDWSANLSQIRREIGPHVAIQGNLDPDILYAPTSKIQQEVNRLLNLMKGDPGYIFNLGHGIHPDIPTDAVKTLVECVKCAS
jgi:uroporphyrinogen decarboxylase